MGAVNSDTSIRGKLNDAVDATNPEWDEFTVTATTQSDWIPVAQLANGSTASFQVKMTGDLAGNIQTQGTNDPLAADLDPVDLGTPTTMVGSDIQHDEAVAKDYAFMRQVITVTGGSTGDVTGVYHLGSKILT